MKTIQTQPDVETQMEQELGAVACRGQKKTADSMMFPFAFLAGMSEMASSKVPAAHSLVPGVAVRGV